MYQRLLEDCGQRVIADSESGELRLRTYLGGTLITADLFGTAAALSMNNSKMNHGEHIE
jgi:hypothetical protein